MTQTALDFGQHDEVMKLAARLRQHGVDVPPLPMSWDEKRELLRTAIRVHHLHGAIAGVSPKKKCETYAVRFERLFATPVETLQRKRK